MKNMKKLASLLLALVLLLAVAAPAMALEEPATYTITINGATPGHKYAAYQIFKGDLHENTLSNIEWGAGVNTAATGFPYEDAADVAEGLTKANAAAFADEIGKYLSTAAAEETVAEGATSCELSGLEAGYYLVKNTSVPEENGAYTAYILKVVNDVEASPKADVPEVEKKVKDTNDSTGEETDWQDSADYDIGDAVPFKLTATLANNVTAYDTYKIIFHDTLSAGLKYNSDAVVKFGDANVTEYFTITHNNGELTIACNDVKAFGATDSSVITVEYTATLETSAVIGSAGNPNEVYLEYSNNPNVGGEGETGKTPEDKVIVFTYKVVVNKVQMNPEYNAEKDPENTGMDSEGQTKYLPLENAGFTLYKKNANGEYVAVGTEMKGAEMTTFEWIGLDDGDYKLIETKTPAGYNTIDPIEFTITATHNENSDDPQLITLTGGDKFSGEVSTGTLTTDIVNEKGVNLPSTGGMGTTLFYLMGAVLLAGAAVVVVSKKRAVEK